MATYSERDLIIPALQAMRRQPGLITSNLINALTDELRPTGRDAQTLGGRRDTHFSQKVRNLRSHRTLENPGLAMYQDGQWFITPKGEQYLDECEEIGASLNQQGLPSTPGEVSPGAPLPLQDIIVEEGAEVSRSVRIRRRSRRLREAAVEQFKDMHEGRAFCSACGFDFERVYGNLGQGFIEMHHTVPIREADRQKHSLAQALASKRIVPLCSNCHRIVHRNLGQMLSLNELKKILQDQRREFREKNLPFD